MSIGPLPPRSRAWPEASQFNEAVQNLAACMSDRELQRSQPELNGLGVPMPYAGNFADVYKVHCPETGNTWAVKFFKREVRDLCERYRAISDQLIASQLPFVVDFRYLDEGVRIGGAWYPLLKMRWIEGLNLNRFVAQSLHQPKQLEKLGKLWVKLAERLHRAKIAHADLQHGNVLLVPEGDRGRLLLRLIDYDGMIVPALADRPSGERGHPAYQHPQRLNSGVCGRHADHFSHLAICCALGALRRGGQTLWDRYDNGDNLLFTASDFAQPAQSPLIQELWALRNSKTRTLVGHLVLATQRPLERVPLISKLLSDGQAQPLTVQEQRKIEAILQGKSEASVAIPINLSPRVMAEVADRRSRPRDLAAQLVEAIRDHVVVQQYLGQIQSAKFVMQTNSTTNAQGGPTLVFDVVGSKQAAEILARADRVDGVDCVIAEQLALRSGVLIRL